MKKIFNVLFFLAIAFGCCFAKSDPPVLNSYSVTQVAGPVIVMPGLPSPVAHFAGATGTIRWRINGRNGSIVSTDPDVFINQGDVSYDAYDVHPPSNCPPLEFCDDIQFFGGSISFPSLAHSIAINHPLDGVNLSRITLTTNADQYRVGVEWFRNNKSVGGGPWNFVDLIMPGVYSAKVTYTYGGQNSTVDVPNVVTVAPSIYAPFVSNSISYNPVIEPEIVVFNNSNFGDYQINLNGSRILLQIHCSTCGPIKFTVTATGIYQVAAEYQGTGIAHGAWQYTDDIIVQNGPLPKPQILSSGPLTYETSQVTLTAAANGFTAPTYNSGYQWFLNGTAIATATQKQITIFKPGQYTVRACARYPDGSVQCITSDAFAVVGEVRHVNFVRTKVPLVPRTLSSDVNGLSFTDMNTSTGFFDEMARPLEQILMAASPAGHDVVSFSQYDAFGREQKKFLPFVKGTGDGNFLVIPQTISPLTSFYGASDDHIANTTVPFAETVFENSPLNRLLQQGSPGEEWQISNNHARSIRYITNSTNDNVFIWKKTATGVAATSYYPAGTLTVTESTDEDGNRSREYKDTDGRVILSERFIEAGARLRTYFVFDDIGRLQFVLSPKTISDLPNSTSVSITSDVLARECYSYEYDERNRATVKNIPGAGSTYIVYDKWDRVVITQSANQRTAGKWTFNKYDRLDRIVMIGEILLAGNYATAQQAINTFYAGVQANPTLRYEEPNGSMHGYTNRSFPVLSNQFQAFSISYYDNYSFLSQFGSGYEFSKDLSEMADNSALVRSLATGSKVLILGGQTYLKSVTYYDDKHRRIQTVSDNHHGGIDRVSFVLDFIGKVMKSKEAHNGLQHVIVEEQFVYDHQGRPTKAYHKINNGTNVLLADKKYNELGQMTEQNIHSTDGNIFLQSQDYVYNIRGWLSQVNPVEPESNVQFQDQYGFELSYTTAPSVAGLPGFQGLFNGNITAFTEIRPGSTDATNAIYKNGFSYRYDARNQLTQANYFQIAGPIQTPTATFDMPSITYDHNGNIRTLQRKGITSGGTPGLIDNLNYDYNGNQLINVSDGADRSKGFIKK